MSNSAFDQKIQAVFGEFAIDKGLVRRLGATGAGSSCAVVRDGLDRLLTRARHPHSRRPIPAVS